MMPTMVLVIVLLIIFLTSLISGIVGMAGGLILIVALVLLMPVPVAMILHGIVQGTANGSRFWFLRKHTAWQILPWYFLGVVLSTAAFSALTIVAEPAVVLIAAGCLPWVSQFTPKRHSLNVTKPSIAVLCGIVTTSAQLIAGASGPILDAFYQRTELNRFQIVATKALTQAIGHIVKIAYYLYVSAVAIQLDFDFGAVWWFLPLAIGLALVGTKFGTLILARLSESMFQKWTNLVILTLGAVVALGGILDLIAR